MSARPTHISVPMGELPRSLRARAVELRGAGDAVGAANLEIAAATFSAS